MCRARKEPSPVVVAGRAVNVELLENGTLPITVTALVLELASVGTTARTAPPFEASWGEVLTLPASTGAAGLVASNAGRPLESPATKTLELTAATPCVVGAAAVTDLIAGADGVVRSTTASDPSLLVTYKVEPT